MRQLFLMLLSVALHAQVVGAFLSGTVRDDSGGGLPQAVVTIRNLETGTVRKLLTDEAGRYSAPSIAVGKYEVEAAKPGFASQLKQGIDLVIGQSATVDLTLPVGELKQAMVVEESPAPVSLSTQQTSGLVGERQVKDLPLNGRSLRRADDAERGDRELHRRSVRAAWARRIPRWATCSRSRDGGRRRICSC